MSLSAHIVSGDEERVRLLIERGLELFGRGEGPAAILCWRAALELEPGNAEALDYMNAAFGDETPPVSSMSGRTRRVDRVVDRGLLRAHLEQGNYEEAWQVLQEALRLHPEDPELTRARDLLEPRVALRIARRMRLSVPPRVEPGTRDSQPDLGERERALLDLAQTCQTYAQILACSPFGDVETLLGLKTLETLGLLGESRSSAARQSEGAIRVGAPTLDLSGVEGLKHFEVYADLDDLVAAPRGLPARCVAELSAALRLLGAEERVEDVAALAASEIQIVRRITKNGPVASVIVDRSVSQLGLARLQVELACQRLGQS